MLKTPKDFTYDKLIDSLSRQDYKIAVNDALVYRVFTNKGYQLVDLSAGSGSLLRTDVDVVVESDGMIKMPLIGKILIKGLTIKEAEKLLEEKYSEYYVDPYITLKVNNRRVIVFPGNGGSARVMPLTNNNTTLMEALATAGGILEDGKAYKVKLIRGNPDPHQKPFVYLLDLSQITGIKDAQSIVQAGDIIYVEPRYKPLATFTKEVAPIVTLMTSFLIVYQLSRILK